jgi:hypothetical protein
MIDHMAESLFVELENNSFPLTYETRIVLFVSPKQGIICVSAFETANAARTYIEGAVRLGKCVHHISGKFLPVVPLLIPEEIDDLRALKLDAYIEPLISEMLAVHGGRMN